METKGKIIEVKVSRVKEKEVDIFKRGNLVVHKTSDTIVMVTKPHKEAFAAVIISDPNEDYKVGYHDHNYFRGAEFQQFYGQIILRK